jgi:hypothetical protein
LNAVRVAERCGPLAAIVVSCALAACGGDDLSAGEQQLRADVTAGLTSKDPDACTQYATQRFVEQLSGERGTAALDSCRADAKNTDFTSIDFERVAISGARASVTISPHGGDESGLERLELKLRKDGGHWKLDRLAGGTLDRAAFVRATRKELTAPPDALSAATSDCVLQQLESVEDDEIIRSLVAADPRLMVVPLVRCSTRTPPPSGPSPEPSAGRVS